MRAGGPRTLLRTAPEVYAARRTIYTGRRPAYPGASLTKVLYLALPSVRDTATLETPFQLRADSKNRLTV